MAKPKTKTVDRSKTIFPASIRRPWKDIPPDAFVSTWTVSQIAGVNPRTVQRHQTRGLLPGGSVIQKAKVVQWLKGVEGTAGTAVEGAVPECASTGASTRRVKCSCSRDILISVFSSVDTPIGCGFAFNCSRSKRQLRLTRSFFGEGPIRGVTLPGEFLRGWLHRKTRPSIPVRCTIRHTEDNKPWLAAAGFHSRAVHCGRLESFDAGPRRDHSHTLESGPRVSSGRDPQGD